ncbi:MAG TPA: hypothetical protein VF188_14360 [Longimicrobiales bacterium]
MTETDAIGIPGPGHPPQRDDRPPDARIDSERIAAPTAARATHSRGVEPAGARGRGPDASSAWPRPRRPAALVPTALLVAAAALASGCADDGGSDLPPDTARAPGAVDAAGAPDAAGATAAGGAADTGRALAVPDTARIAGAPDAAGGSRAADPAARAAAAVVERFGARLARVSLLAPDSVVRRQIRAEYGPLVTPALLESWLRDPSAAPGRAVSSPWPDRIEVREVRRAGAGVYDVVGHVVYVTSVEVAEGGAARRERLAATVVVDGAGRARIRAIEGWPREVAH